MSEENKKTQENPTLKFLKETKDKVKNTSYRKRFDAMAREVDDNLINTQIRYGRLGGNNVGVVQTYTQYPDGTNNLEIVKKVVETSATNPTLPVSEEPIAFSKLLVAVSALFSNVPDFSTFSANKIKARMYYEMLKRSWTRAEQNGLMTVQTAGTNMLKYGFGAWRTYPKREIVDKTKDGKKVPKIIFDDIVREPLDPRRTWFGLSYKPYANDGRPEILYEIDITKEAYEKLLKEFGKRKGKNEKLAGVSQEAIEIEQDKGKTHVTITFYENPKENRYIVASDNKVLVDGEMPNEELYGSVVVASCFSRDMNDPHGVSVYELIRGNVKIVNYLNSLVDEQVEAEIAPLLFAIGAESQTGDNKSYKRNPNELNTLPAGVKLESFRTNGNPTLAINVVDKKRLTLEQNSGITDVMAGTGTENGLGITMLMKEASLNRWVIPRNNFKLALEQDSCIYFSLLEQVHSVPREFEFSTTEELEVFKKLNPTFFVQEQEDETGEVPDDYDEAPADGNGIIRAYVSENIPMSFDIEITPKEDGSSEINMSELSEPKYTRSVSSLFKEIEETDQPESYGYDKVIAIADMNSMLIPSKEVQKQVSMQIFPLIQNSITTIFALVRQDPAQAVVQLQAFKTFLETQDQDIYKYIPKESYDLIMGGDIEPDLQTEMAINKYNMEMMGMPSTGGEQGLPSQMDGTSVTQPQDSAELPRNQMNDAYNASLGKMG